MALRRVVLEGGAKGAGDIGGESSIFEVRDGRDGGVGG
jgi:hypothetical protein